MKFKKLLLAIACLSMPMLSYAQAQEHLTFKNIPINGTVNQFAQKLVAQGCKITYSEGNSIMMKGEFLGRQCTIGLIGTSRTKTIWRVGIFLPEQETWQSIKNQYFQLKQQYQQKYGEGTSVELFTSSLDPEKYNLEMSAIDDDECVYITVFDCGIGIQIQKGISYGTARIRIVYDDPINSALNDKERYDEI